MGSNSFPALLNRYPHLEDNKYVDAHSITFPWVVSKKEIPPHEVKGLDQFVKEKYGEKS